MGLFTWLKRIRDWKLGKAKNPELGSQARTLWQHMFEWQDLGIRPLITWKQRMLIALDVARELESLHSTLQPSFFYRDLKPTNILVGDDLRAKLADIELVKNVTGRTDFMTHMAWVAGPSGYLDPRYVETGHMRTELVVYAFGVILMELITGRKALDDNRMPEETRRLVPWFRGILISKDDIRNAVDDLLDPDDETFECILRVAELAGRCTSAKFEERPDIGHVVNVLAPLV